MNQFSSLPPRKQPMKRTASPRSKRKPRQAWERLEDMAAWDREQTRCALCWRPLRRRENWARHHCCNGKYGRRNDRRNVLPLCNDFMVPPCHMLVELHKVPRQEGGHWPKVTFEMQLTLLIEAGTYDPEFLQSLMGSRLLQPPEPLPEIYLLERTYHSIGA